MGFSCDISYCALAILGILIYLKKKKNLIIFKLVAM